jgi:hypothetical protein
VQDHRDTPNRSLILRHPICAAAIAMLLLGLIADGLRRDVVGKTVLYLTTVGLSILILQLANRSSGENGEPVRVYAPITELLLFSVNAIVAFGFLWAHFILDLQPASIASRLLFFGIGLGALFNVFLMIGLTALGYSRANWV